MKMPRPTGQLQGDDKAMPMKSEGDMAMDNYGANLSPSAINRVGGISSATKSDAAMDDKADGMTPDADDK